jgi:polyisoprenoid-binding protein YceI
MKRKWFVFLVMFILLTACSAPVATQPPGDSPKPEGTNTLPTESLLKSTLAPSQIVSKTPGETVSFEIVPEESSVTYEVGETFLNQDNRFNLAVGQTTMVSGTIFANLSDPQASSLGEFQIDISQFTSDSRQRDNAIRNNWLESARFPLATFKPISIEGLPEHYIEGQDYSFHVTGDLTVKETTRSVTFDVTANLQAETLTGKATTTLLLSDFGIGPITILGVLKTEDEARVTLDFVARRS